MNSSIARGCSSYEWVEGVLRESADTVEGRVQHKRVDRETKGMPPADELTEEPIHTRSVTLSSERLLVIAKMDLIEVKDGAVTPVDYKRGKPREYKNGLELWPTDRVQLTVQGLILRENGYVCAEGVVYYTSTKQRASGVRRGRNSRSGASYGKAWRVAREG